MPLLDLGDDSHATTSRKPHPRFLHCLETCNSSSTSLIRGPQSPPKPTSRVPRPGRFVPLRRVSHERVSNDLTFSIHPYSTHQPLRRARPAILHVIPPRAKPLLLVGRVVLRFRIGRQHLGLGLPLPTSLRSSGRAGDAGRRLAGREVGSLRFLALVLLRARVSETRSASSTGVTSEGDLTL